MGKSPLDNLLHFFEKTTEDTYAVPLQERPYLEQYRDVVTRNFALMHQMGVKIDMQAVHMALGMAVTAESTKHSVNVQNTAPLVTAATDHIQAAQNNVKAAYETAA